MMVDYCISLGISPKRIHIINPSSIESVFPDEQIAKMVLNEISNLKVNHYEGHVFQSHSEENGQIFSIQLKVLFDFIFRNQMESKLLLVILAFFFTPIKRILTRLHLKLLMIVILFSMKTLL